MSYLTRLQDRKFNGYLRIRLPHPLDDEVAQAVNEYRAAVPGQRARLLDGLTDRSAGVLNAHGQRMASMAVRTNDPTHLQAGLLSVCMANGHLEDNREIFYSLAALNDAAERLGTSLNTVLESVADQVPAAAQQQALIFDNARPLEKSLKAYRLRPTGEGDGFYYR